MRDGLDYVEETKYVEGLAQPVSVSVSPQKRNLYAEMQAQFNPSDTDGAKKLAYHSLFLSIRAYRAVWAYNNGLRLGRDDAGLPDGSLAAVGKALGFDLHNGKSSDEFFKALAEATGLEYVEDGDKVLIYDGGKKNG